MSQVFIAIIALFNEGPNREKNNELLVPFYMVTKRVRNLYEMIYFDDITIVAPEKVVSRG